MSHLKLIVIIVIYLVTVEYVYNCSKRRMERLLHPHIVRVEDDDIEKYVSEDSFQPIRVEIDWSLFNENVKDVNKAFAKAIREEVIPQTVEIYQKIVKVRRFKKKLNFPHVSKCDTYTVPEKLKREGVIADLVIFPILESTGEFITERVEAAASYCAQSSLDGRPIMGFIEYRPNLEAGDQHHVDYHIWLTFHELTHVFVFNDSLFDTFINPLTGQKLPKDQVMRKYEINGMDMNFVVSPKVRELAAKHFNCPNAIGVPLENKGSEGTKDSHWNRKAMNGDVMIAKSFGENLISDITLALFEDSGWYKVDYSLSNLFIWGKNRGCDFLYCKDCFENKQVDSKNNIFNVKSKYPREFCSNFNNPVCSTHNYFRGSCAVSENITSMSEHLKFMPFSQANFGGGDMHLDYCPIAQETKDNQDYYGGSCKLGSTNNLHPHEKVCPNCACVVSNLDPISLLDVAEKKKLKIKMGKAKLNTTDNKIYFKKSKHLRSSCMEFTCKEHDGKKDLYINVFDSSYKCDKRYIEIPELGTIKCPLRSLLCHEKFNCKFGCVTRFGDPPIKNRKLKKAKKMSRTSRYKTKKKRGFKSVLKFK